MAAMCTINHVHCHSLVTGLCPGPGAGWWGRIVTVGEGGRIQGETVWSVAPRKSWPSKVGRGKREQPGGQVLSSQPCRLEGRAILCLLGAGGTPLGEHASLMLWTRAPWSLIADSFLSSSPVIKAMACPGRRV